MSQSTKFKPYSNLDYMRAVRNADSLVGERIPEPTLQNIAEIQNFVLQSEDLRNRYILSLVNRVGLHIQSAMEFYNPLAPFKKGTMENGAAIEESFVEIAKAFPYSPEIAEETHYRRVKPQIATVFHRINREEFYKVTIEYDELRRAFLSDTGVAQMVDRIIDSLGRGNQVDEYLLMKELLIHAANNGAIKNHYLGANFASGITADNAHQLVTQLKAMSDTFLYPSNEYNKMGVLNAAPKDRQILILDPLVNATIDVEVLSAAFHQQNAEFMGRIVMLDSLQRVTGCYAMLIDERFFMVYDILMRTEQNRNAEGLYTNNFFHVHQILSYSIFHNAVMFTNVQPTIDSVTITPASTTATRKSIISFAATVATSGGNELQGVTWELSGAAPLKSFIDPMGNVQIGITETNTELTVKATSVVDPTKSAEATITIS